jgi:hypothetical protein
MVDQKARVYLGCEYCLHYTGAGRCKAFPTGIPLSILAGSHDHRTPWLGDNGIRFAAKADANIGAGG